MGDTGTQPWDRRSDESAKAYQAAQLYFTLGAGRSQEAVARELAKSRQLLSRWSARYAWQVRAQAYDLHLIELVEQARAAAVAADAARWEERRRQLREDGWIAAEKLYARAVEMLAFPLATVERTEKVRQSPDGRQIIIEQTTITPAKWSFRDVAYIVDIAVKLARLSAEMETDRSLFILEGLTPKDLDSMSMEQLQLLKQQLARRR